MTMFVRHGYCTKQAKTPAEYGVWIEMRRRCFNPRNKSWHNYGGRGITMCDRWRKSFDAFLTDMGSRPSSRHSIERIDNDGDYEPGNCCWATAKEQRANQRVALKPVIRSDGKRYVSIAEAAEDNETFISSITSVCRGKWATTHGYGWIYADRVCR